MLAETLECEAESSVALHVLVQKSYTVTPAHISWDRNTTKEAEKCTPTTVMLSKTQRRGCYEWTGAVTHAHLRRRGCRLTEGTPAEQWQGQWMAPETSAGFTL